MTTMREIPAELGYGGAHPNRSVLQEILAEHREALESIQNQIAALNAAPQPDYIRTTVVSGAAVDTNIAVSGILTTHTLLGVVKLDFALAEGDPNTRTWDADDLLSEASVTSDGNIQLSTTETSPRYCW